MDILVNLIKTNPLLYAFFVVTNSLLVGAGAGMGLYKGINKLFDYWISIKVNTDQIPALVELNKDNYREQQKEIENLKKILEKHDLEVKEEIRKNS